MRSVQVTKLFAQAVLLPSLVSCGGGGGDAGEPPRPAPVPDLEAVISTARVRALPNQENTLTVTVQNRGSAPAVGAVLAVPAVSGFSYESVICAATQGASCPAPASAQSFQGGVTLPDFPVLGILTFQFAGIATGGAGSEIRFAASVSVVGDSFPASNSPQRTVPIDAPATGNLVLNVPSATYPMGSDEWMAFNWINSERLRCGMGLLKQDLRLDMASEDHANYLAVNIDSGFISDISHAQDPARPGYTGGDGTARAQFRGYPGVSGDLIAYGGTALQSYQALFAEATYHSLSAQRGGRDIGLGSRKPARWSGPIAVLNTAIPVVPQTPEQAMAASQSIAGDAVVTYPCGGETLLGRSHDNERPSPLPNVDLTQRGAPITVFVRTMQELRIREFSLSTAAGTPLSGTLLTIAERPGNLDKSEAAFIADAPLPPNTTFNVLIRGTNEGQRFEKRFSFSTGS